MLLAYILENTNKDEIRDNSPLFQLINEMEIGDEYTFIDSEGKDKRATGVIGLYASTGCSCY